VRIEDAGDALDDVVAPVWSDHFGSYFGPVLVEVNAPEHPVARDDLIGACRLTKRLGLPLV